MVQQTFTRQEVVDLIETILQNPDTVIDAVTNENTNYGAEELLEMAEKAQLLTTPTGGKKK